MEEETFLEQVVGWFFDSGIVILIVILGTGIVRGFLRTVINKFIRNAIKADNFATKQDEQQREETIIRIIDAFLKIVIWIIAGMIILDQLGVNIAPLLASAGILGLAIGFGAQSLVEDIVSGMFIIVENQYRVGDVIEIAEVSGTVENITLRTTVLRDGDGNQHHIPNGKIERASNMSMEFARINLIVLVSYDSDLDKVEKVVNEVGQELSSDNEWKDKITETPLFSRVNGFTESGVEIKIGGKVKPSMQWAVAGEYRKRLKKSFDKNHIEIPFPQLVVHKKN